MGLQLWQFSPPKRCPVTGLVQDRSSAMAMSALPCPPQKVVTTLRGALSPAALWSGEVALLLRPCSSNPRPALPSRSGLGTTIPLTSHGPSATVTSGTRKTTWEPGTASPTWRRDTLDVGMLTALEPSLVMGAR